MVGKKLSEIPVSSTGKSDLDFITKQAFDSLERAIQIKSEDAVHWAQRLYRNAPDYNMVLYGHESTLVQDLTVEEGRSFLDVYVMQICFAHGVVDAMCQRLFREKSPIIRYKTQVQPSNTKEQLFESVMRCKTYGDIQNLAYHTALKMDLGEVLSVLAKIRQIKYSS